MGKKRTVGYTPTNDGGNVVLGTPAATDAPETMIEQPVENGTENAMVDMINDVLESKNSDGAGVPKVAKSCVLAIWFNSDAEKDPDTGRIDFQGKLYVMFVDTFGMVTYGPYPLLDQRGEHMSGYQPYTALQNAVRMNWRNTRDHIDEGKQLPKPTALDVKTYGWGMGQFLCWRNG